MILGEREGGGLNALKLINILYNILHNIWSLFINRALQNNPPKSFLKKHRQKNDVIGLLKLYYLDKIIDDSKCLVQQITLKTKNIKK